MGISLWINLAEGGFRMMVIPPITKQYRILVYNWNIGCL